MRQSKASAVALGGMLTAAAIVIMCLGSVIPVNTYVCPVAAILMTRPVLSRCGKKIAFCYYLAVAILSALMAPDKEAAFIYVFLGYYPLIQPLFRKIQPKVLRLIAKLLYFTVAGAAAYLVIFSVMGVWDLVLKMSTAELVLMGIMILSWDALFVMVDVLLEAKLQRRRRRK